jgi:hypothetical protein
MNVVNFSFANILYSDFAEPALLGITRHFFHSYPHPINKLSTEDQDTNLLLLECL